MLKLVKIGLSQYGIKELPGINSNPEINKYFDSTGYSHLNLKEETAWCSAFINWCADKAGLEHTGQLFARSWLKTGIQTEEPKLGDVVIFWRGKSPNELITGSNIKKGHVGIFIRETDYHIYCLGGNQSNSVNIAAYSRNRLLGYRRLRSQEEI